MALATVAALAGPAAADPEPKRAPAPQDSAALQQERAGLVAQTAAEKAGAVSVGWDPATKTMLAVYPRGMAAPNLGKGTRAVQASLDKAGLKQFDATMKARTWAARAGSYGYAYHVDAATGRMVVSTDAPKVVTDVLARRFAGVEVRKVGTAARMSRQYDTQPFWGGASITNGSSVCSSGFVVQNSAGTRFMVTAGHCFLAGNAVSTTGGGLSFGSVVNRASFPTWDLELIGGASYGTYIYTGNLTGTGTPTGAASDPFVGSSYCSSGQTSGETCGHVVSSLSGTFCDASGCTPSLIVASGGGSILGGDSGSPFYFPSGGRAYIRGVTIAVAGADMYAERWNTVANYFGVTLAVSP